MKKSLFKVLCMVLIIALLAPNAFAATPAPEAPLADAATVERVKQEIANGEITDMEDLFLVAYQHLGADLEEEGMTAYINEDGTLGVTQIIENDNEGASVYSLNGSIEEKTIAVMSLGAYDSEGNILSDYYYHNYPISKPNSDRQGLVYVTHTMNITVRGVGMYVQEKVRLNNIATQISHSTNTYLTSELVQEYIVVPEALSGTYSNSKTTAWPGSGTHTFYASDTGWHNPSSGSVGGYFQTASTLTVVNIEEPIHIDLKVKFVDIALLS